MDSNRLQPAFLGGLLIGVLSGLPVVNVGNCCCCLWVLMGGALAVYLRQQNMPYQIQSSEGSLMGLMAGFIGGIIAGLISIPMSAMSAGFMQQFMDRMMANNPDIPPESKEMIQRAMSMRGGMAVAGAAINVVIYTVFGLLGGLIGVAIFKKKDAPPPPPPGTIVVPPSSTAGPQ